MCDDCKIEPLRIMSTYLKCYDGQTKWVYSYFIFFENDELLKKYNTIWDKVTAYYKKC